MTETTGRTSDRDQGPRPRPGGWPPFAGAADAPPRRAPGLVLHCIRLVAGWRAPRPGIPAVGPLILAAVGPRILAAVGPSIAAAVGPSIAAAVGPRVAAGLLRSAPGPPRPGWAPANQ